MRNFLRQVLATVCGIAIAAALAFFAFASIVGREARPEVPAPAYVVLDGTLAIGEAGGRVGPLELIEGRPPAVPLRRVLQALEAAAHDERIRGVVIAGLPQVRGWPAREALRAALEDLRAAGKRVIAHGTDWDEADYFLACVADDVSLAPFGTLQLDGLAAELLYLGDALEHVGVQVQVARVGSYKSAAETLMQGEMSEENRAQLAALLKSVDAAFVRGVAASRGVDEEALRTLMAQHALWSSEEAVAAGLVDRVAYLDELLAELRAEVGAGDADRGFAQIGFRDWMTAHESPAELEEHDARIHVLYAEGLIVDGEQSNGVGGDTLARELRALREDDEADAVVLRVNSPGGSAAASEVILREMEMLARAKPVIVSMGEVAASGGYWISCSADAIVARPTTITGSIGVLAILPNLAGTLDMAGVRVQTVKSAAHADLASPWRAKSVEELQIVQRLVRQVYDGFIARVAAGRGLEPGRVEELAQGRVWSGADALKRGLVDRLGGLDDAVALAAERLDVPQWQVVYHEPEPSAWEKLVAQSLEGERPPLAWEAATLARATGADALAARALLRAGADGRSRPLALLPWTARLR